MSAQKSLLGGCLPHHPARAFVGMQQHNRPESYDVLADAGADEGIRDFEGKTPLLYAAKLGRREMISHILQRRRKVSSPMRTRAQSSCKDLAFVIARVAARSIPQGSPTERRKCLITTALPVACFDRQQSALVCLT